MFNEKLYYIIILFLSGISFIGISYPSNTNIETYSNSEVGLEFKFLFTWELQSDNTNDKNCNPICDIFEIPSEVGVSVIISSYNLTDPIIESKCKCNTLKEFVKYEYVDISWFLKSLIEQDDGELLYDNPILNNNNISGWEMESKFEGGDSFRQHYDFWTIQNDIGYSISYTANEGLQYEKYLPELQDMIKSLKFIPIEIPPKKNVPSFLQ